MSLKLRRGTNVERGTVTPADGEPIWCSDTKQLYVGDGSTAGGIAVDAGGSAPVDSVNGQTGVVILDTDDLSDASSTNKFTTAAANTKVGHITVTQAVDLDTIESDTATNNGKVSYTDAAVVALNTTHRSSDGKDHSDVVANNAKISYTDGAAVALNTTHRSSDGKDHSDVVANNAKVSYPSADATKVGYITVTQAVNLDTMESDIATNNGKISYTDSAAVSANTSHRTGDGSDHADVATNTTHRNLTNNPHGVVASDVGLGNCNNTSDADKPVSTAQQTEIDTKEDALGNPSTNNYVLASQTDGTRSWVENGSGGGGVTDHGALTGLGDDDHSQYHNDARGDARYLPLSATASDIAVTDTADHFTGTDIEAVLAEIGETRLVSGYDLTDTDTLPDIAFTTGTRTFTASVKGGQANFSFWVNNKKITKTTTQSVVIPDTTDTYYIYFDNSGVLQYVAQGSIVPAVFYENAITGLVYWNATAETAIVGNEVHGKLMDGRTHHFNHATYGARFESGLDVTGLVDANDTYTAHTSGYFWDEDIRHELSLQPTAPFIYRLGATGEWTGSTPDNKVGFMNGGSDVVWNEWTGSTWQLTPSTSTTDYIIIFTIATSDLSGYNVKKVIGQNGYASRRDARDAIEDEIASLVMDGLPSPEFVFLQAWIVRRNGDLENLADGSTHVDLRTVKGGVSGNSTATAIANEVAADVTNFNGALSSADTNVQLALETIDDTVALNTTHRTSDGKNHSDVVANNAKISFDSASSTKVGYITVTQAVNLDTMESNIATNNDKISYTDSVDVATNTTHRGLTNNPHSVDATDVGLGNCNNTSDADKPVSTAQQTAIDTKEDALGNPSTNNYVLASQTDGTRSWVENGSGGGASISDTAYDATSWNGDTTNGASKNAIRDKIETMDAASIKDADFTSNGIMSRTASGTYTNVTSGVMDIWSGTQASYDAISTPSTTTLYLITG